MVIFSLADCCRMLAIDPKTLRRWLERSHLCVQPAYSRCPPQVCDPGTAASGRRCSSSYPCLLCKARISNWILPSSRHRLAS